MIRPEITAAALFLVGCSDSAPNIKTSQTATGDESFVVINHEYLFFTDEEYPVLPTGYITSRMHDDYTRLLIEEKQKSKLEPQAQAKMERLAGHFYHNDPLWRLEQEIIAQLDAVSHESGRELQSNADIALKEALANLYGAKAISDPERILNICSELRYCILSHQPERIRTLSDQGFFDPNPAPNPNEAEQNAAGQPATRSESK